MSAAQATPTTEFRPRRRRVLTQVGLVLILGLLLCVGYLRYDAANSARQQTVDTGNALMHQAARLLQPLLLADDRVSLNYLVNELGERPDVAGIALHSADGELVARSGAGDGPIEQSMTLEREQQNLGRLQFWLDPAPLERRQLAQLYPLGLFWLLTSLAVLATLWTSLRPKPVVIATAPEPATEPPQPVPEAQQEPEEPVADAAQPLAGATDEEVAEPEPAPENGRQEPGFEGLLDLLRPVKERLMPRFQPSAPQGTDDEQFVDIDDEPDLPPPAPAPRRANPLRARDDEEEQLGLYSFEHELELILAPEDAQYLLLIDAASGHADFVEEEERTALLQQYRRQAEQIAGIYSGEVEPLANGDIRIWFRDPVEEDGHGANALCAAKLFTLLYRTWNQSRIRNFQPVLSLHMALVRGNRERRERILDEAQFLTRSTQSNELISHTALTEAPMLKQHLLEGADVRRESEDKVLILTLSEGYEELLQKQAEHLINKP
ncbi:hypothetical protein GCM10011348_11010 [Marinobacterium nitratireducens]|uniref:Uncharacterized protein n=1 Tax=Marinobacterium nitratireducens TaxID=518897 RepID=A0A918DQG5_9GAMM|nr:hypothetical protein [Marinobacterium nitratireducens]GGO78630.1 hypothetical protein GCM10011348_11010 [Marinobacterium nitratireducens]